MNTQNESAMNNPQIVHVGRATIIRNPNMLTSEEQEKDKRFKEEIAKFFRERGKNFKCPILGGRELHMNKLYHEVTSRGK